MSLTRILIDSSLPVQIQDQAYQSLYEHARSIWFDEFLAYSLNALLTLEPPLLQEKLAFIQKFLAPNIFIHSDFGFNFQPLTAPLLPYRQDGDEALYPRDIAAQCILPPAMNSSNHTQQVDTQGHQINCPSVVDATPESASIGILFDQIFDDCIQIPPENPQHDIMPLITQSDFTLQENPGSSLEALPFISNSPQAPSPGVSMRDHDMEDRIESGNNSDNTVMAESYPTPLSIPSHTPKPANRVSKRMHRGKGKAVHEIGNQPASMIADLARPEPSPLDGAESMRLDLLRSLTSKTGQAFEDQTLRTISEMGDRIVNDTVVVLNNWSEWRLREFQPPGVLLPSHDPSAVEICAVAYRLLVVGTHSDTRHRSVHRRLAQVLLNIFIPEVTKEIVTRGSKGEMTYNGRQPTTIAHDLIVDKVGALERDAKKCDRTHLGDCKSYGRRWWRLGSGIGIVAVLAGSQDLAKHMECRSFVDGSLELLVNYIGNAYPSAVAHFQSLDPVFPGLFTNISSLTDPLMNLDRSRLQFNTLSGRVHWINTEDTMATATKNFLRAFRQE